MKVLVCKAMKNVQVLDAEKKLAWTGLDRVNFEKKIFNVKCSNQKIGVDRSREFKNGLFSGKCLFIKFLHDWSHKSLDLTRGAVDATPSAAAFSLTFSLVKN